MKDQREYVVPKSGPIILFSDYEKLTPSEKEVYGKSPSENFLNNNPDFKNIPNIKSIISNMATNTGSYIDPDTGKISILGEENLYKTIKGYDQTLNPDSGNAVIAGDKFFQIGQSFTKDGKNIQIIKDIDPKLVSYVNNDGVKVLKLSAYTGTSSPFRVESVTNIDDEGKSTTSTKLIDAVNKGNDGGFISYSEISPDSLKITFNPITGQLTNSAEESLDRLGLINKPSVISSENQSIIKQIARQIAIGSDKNVDLGLNKKSENLIYTNAQTEPSAGFSLDLSGLYVPINEVGGKSIELNKLPETPVAPDLKNTLGVTTNPFINPIINNAATSFSANNAATSFNAVNLNQPIKVVNTTIPIIPFSKSKNDQNNYIPIANTRTSFDVTNINTPKIYTQDQPGITGLKNVLARVSMPNLNMGGLLGKKKGSPNMVLYRKPKSSTPKADVKKSIKKTSIPKINITTDFNFDNLISTVSTKKKSEKSKVKTPTIDLSNMNFDIGKIAFKMPNLDLCLKKKKKVK